MNPYYRLQVIADLTLAFVDVHAEISPNGTVSQDSVTQTATFGYQLLQDWDINTEHHDLIVSEALSNAHLTSE